MDSEVGRTAAESVCGSSFLLHQRKALGSFFRSVDGELILPIKSTLEKKVNKRTGAILK